MCGARRVCSCAIDSVVDRSSSATYIDDAMTPLMHWTPCHAAPTYQATNRSTNQPTKRTHRSYLHPHAHRIEAGFIRWPGPLPDPDRSAQQQQQQDQAGIAAQGMASIGSGAARKGLAELTQAFARMGRPSSARCVGYAIVLGWIWGLGWIEPSYACTYLMALASAAPPASPSD